MPFKYYSELSLSTPGYLKTKANNTISKRVNKCKLLMKIF
jgi:hypothetical protein